LSGLADAPIIATPRGSKKGLSEDDICSPIKLKFLID